MDLTIIIPVYNTEKYLRRCLDSVFTQNFSMNYEVIVVNDASTDGSATILEEYRDRYVNCKVITQRENMSLAVARRTGIDAARGRYIMHIDSDDWIRDGALEDLFKNVQKYNYPDVVVFNYERNDGETTLVEKKIINEIMMVDEVNKREFQVLFMGSCCNKMVKKNMLENLVYGERYINTTEDLLYSFEVFLKSSKILLLPNIYYCYFVNRISLTSTIDSEKYLKAQELVYNLLSEIVKVYKPKGEYLINVKNYLDNWLVLELFKNHFSKQIQKDTFYKMIKEYNIFSVNKECEFLERCYNYKIFAFKEVLKRFGVMSTMKLVIKLMMK
ncbi:glycosyltransferase family 2 protein [Riemerella anatipestifer]|uniref:glycosyltransferase family 2 protein n=1 Tax=Riemerella anatipestifer TaxID=34085 RepID=UPI0021B15869|nr:glycosyltransferase family 2 protein [Riemerella anatipestifer]MCT6764017.1 glycosyltransferase [Riemerella anatipestifer]MCT6768196.1 glycosyltransferase [Riemerella anatipestifer]MCU7592714.1 glycosyltransferase [Riemerella anatipestifer]MCU7601017.1 glycosyltransferase [Riemerella anatipestifer]MCU7609151.1 glycosyltransferase [Riemerella anatipestifer]